VEFSFCAGMRRILCADSTGPSIMPISMTGRGQSHSQSNDLGPTELVQHGAYIGAKALLDI
jgi:hypothetical protein